MRLRTLCLQDGVYIKTAGKDPQGYNREQMKRLTAHLVRCRACQRLAGVTFPIDKEERANIPDNSTGIRQHPSTLGGVPAERPERPRLVHDDGAVERSDSTDGGISPGTRCSSIRKCNYHSTGGRADQPCGSDTPTRDTINDAPFNRVNR